MNPLLVFSKAFFARNAASFSVLPVEDTEFDIVADADTQTV